MSRGLLIAAIVLAGCFPLRLLRLVMAGNDVPLSSECWRWIVVNAWFDLLTLVLLFVAILD